jgi:HAD superfamily hydrolase (TIGR01509 family)
LTNFDALLFDFDGVLADTEPHHYECWRRITQPFGIQLDWGYYQKHCIGVADRILAQRWGLTEPDSWVRRKQADFRKALEVSPPFLPDTLQLVRELSLNQRLAVVSSSGRTEVEPPLVTAGIRHCFQVLITCEDVARIKPAPDPYLKAAEILGARKPLVIEDSDAGVASGEAAGFEVLRISAPADVAAEVRRLLARRP